MHDSSTEEHWTPHKRPAAKAAGSQTGKRSDQVSTIQSNNMTALATPDVEAVELEAVREEIPDLMLTEDTFYTRLKKAGRVIPMSTSTGGGYGSSFDASGRPALRIPMRIKAGSTHTQFDANGGDMGRGTGSNYAAQFLSPVSFSEACEITAQAQWSTDSGKKSRVNVKATEFTHTLEQFKSNLDADLQGDGSGTLATVTAASSGSGAAGPSFSNLTVDNANQFYDNQVIQVFPSVGGTTRGAFQISFVDGVTNTLWSADPLPSAGGATAANDILVVNGAAGTAGTSIMGIKAYQVNGNTGTLNGLSRNQYPGRLSTPTVDLGGAAITEATGRFITSKIALALGNESPALADLAWYANVDQAAALENLAVQVAITNQQQIKGDSSQDMLKKFTPSTFVGYDIIKSVHALPGRLDALCLKYWGIGELKAADLYDVNGQTTFPTIGNSGGINASSIFYFVTSMNVYNSNVRAGAYIQNAQIPDGIFG
jgi:hypothetical protein